MYIVKSLVIYYSMKTANEDRSSSAGQGWILAGGRKGLIFGGSAVCRLPFSLC